MIDSKLKKQHCFPHRLQRLTGELKGLSNLYIVGQIIFEWWGNSCHYHTFLQVIHLWTRSLNQSYYFVELINLNWYMYIYCLFTKGNGFPHNWSLASRGLCKKKNQETPKKRTAIREKLSQVITFDMSTYHVWDVHSEEFLSWIVLYIKKVISLLIIVAFCHSDKWI